MALDPDQIQVPLFDVDGTLLDTDDLLVARVSSWLAPLSPFLPGGDPQRTARRLVMRAETPGNTLLHWLDRLNLDGRLVALNDALYRRGWRKPPRDFPLIPGTMACLDRLGRHYRLAIVSARDARTVSAFLQHHNLTSRLSLVVTGQSSRLTKPYPDPILWAAERLGVTPEACLMVGDTTVDILAGKAAGAQTVGVLSGFGTEEELNAAGADLILPSVAHLPEALGLA